MTTTVKSDDDVIMMQERLTRVVEGSKVLRAENATLWRVYDAGVALVAAHCTPGSPGQACIDFQDALAAVPPRGEKGEQNND